MTHLRLLVGLVLAALLLAAAPAHAQSARGGRTSEWVVTNSAGGSTFTTVSGRTAIELQNLGPNAIYCTVGPYNGSTATPLATGALGRKIDAGATWSLMASGSVVLKCIAATAAQVSGAATQVTELR